MTDRTDKPRNPEHAEIEREARVSRKFTLVDAIGRSLGGLLKGTSPVTRKHQAEVAIESLLEHHLRDSERALSIVLLRQVSGSEELLASYDDAAEALKEFVEGLLVSEKRLGQFVNWVDAEWGRIYLERPHFDLEQQPPDPEDPYTVDGVRDRLVALLESLPR
jgi:hypothetical protein